MDVLPESVREEYSDLKQIAKTQFSTLFVGTHNKTNLRHCLKLSLTSETTASLKKEYDFLKKHPHPQFPKVYSWQSIKPQKGLIIREFIPGEPLNQFGGKLSQDQIFNITAQISRGLASIHFLGLCFEDVSPNNFIYSDNKVTFIDFEFLDERHKANTVLKGTPSFMAPELFHGNPPTIQSDLYALGALLNFLVAGEVPFKGVDYQELIQSQLFTELPNPTKDKKGFFKDFGLLILRLLNKEPAERFLEANELLRELNKYCETDLEKEPEPESLEAQEKIRALKGFSLYTDARVKLEKKKSKGISDIVTLCRLYLKSAQIDKLTPYFSELPPEKALFFQTQAYNAVGKYQETEKLLEANKNSDTEELILPRIASLYHLGKRESAQKIMEKAIRQLREKKEDEKLAVYQCHYGNFLLFNRQIGAAIDHYEKGYHAAQKSGLVYCEALSLMNMANAYQARYHWTEALNTFQKAKRIYELVGNHLETTRTALNLSGLYRFLGHVEKSRELLEEAKRFLKKFDNPQLSIYALLLETDLEKKQKHFSQAKDLFEKAENILKKHYTAAEEADLLISRAEVALEEENVPEVALHFGKLDKVVSDQEDPLLNERYRALKQLSFVINPREEFHVSRLIARFKEIVSQGDIEFALDNLSRAIRLCEKKQRQADYESLMEYQNDLLKLCDKKLPADFRERFFFFYRHHPQEPAVPPTSSFLLKRILDTTRELMSELDLNILVKKILHLMMEVTRTDRGFVILNEETPTIAHTHKMESHHITSEENPDAISWTLTNQALVDRKPLMTIDALGDERFSETKSVHRLKLRSILILPFLFRGEVMGAVYLDSRLKSDQLKRENLPYLEGLSDQIGIALHNARVFEETENELFQAKKVLDQQERELHFKYSYQNFIGRSPKTLKIFEMLDKVIDTQVPVLIQGESGSGKEMIAKIIHFNSKRKNKNLVSINCGAIPETLLESELFGHVRGAFTGATENKIGLFEQADGGTLFLDEIGDMPVSMQIKLLRTLQEMEIRPVGGIKSKKVNVRIICATHRNLEEWIQLGKFREDLYFRINVAEIAIPPLRERTEDIPLLVQNFLNKYADDNQIPAKKILPDALSFLVKYSWPGNVRQLENTVYNLCVFTEGSTITHEELEKRQELFPPLDQEVDKAETLSEDSLSTAIDEKKISLSEAKHVFEKEQISRVLKIYDGRVVKTAQHLQMPRPQVSRLIKRYHIDKKNLH